MCRSNRKIKRIKLSIQKKKRYGGLTNMEYDFTFPNECACIVSGYNTFHTFLLNCFLFSFVVKKLLHGKKIRFKLKHLGFFFSLKKLPAIITLTE